MLPQPSEPVKRWFLRPSAVWRIERSTTSHLPATPCAARCGQNIAYDGPGFDCLIIIFVEYRKVSTASAST